jgi:hypothetical protein
MQTFLLVYLVLGLIVGAFYVGVGWPIERSWSNARLLVGVVLLWPLWVVFAFIMWKAGRLR